MLILDHLLQHLDTAFMADRAQGKGQIPPHERLPIGCQGTEQRHDLVPLLRPHQVGDLRQPRNPLQSPSWVRVCKVPFRLLPKFMASHLTHPPPLIRKRLTRDCEPACVHRRVGVPTTGAGGAVSTPESAHPGG